MKIERFNELMKSGKYEVHDSEYPNIPFSRWNHVITDKESGLMMMTIKISEDEIAFIEVRE